MANNTCPWFSQTFTAASSAITSTSYLDIPVPFGVGVGNDAGAQVLRIFAVGNHASGTATLQLVIAADDADGTSEAGVVWRDETTTCASTTRRDHYDNANGNYVCNVVWGSSGTNMVDLLGFGFNGCKLKLGCTALSNFTSLTVYAVWSRVA